MEVQESKIAHPDSLLVIVGMQKGFLNNKTEHLVNDIHDLMEHHKFSHIVCTKFINSKSSPFVKLLGREDMQTIQETEVISEVSQYAEAIFPTYGYSCWTDEFIKYVSRVLPKTIYFIGLNTEDNVLVSATECISKNVLANVLANYCDSTKDIQSHEAGLAVIERLIGENNVIYN